MEQQNLTEREKGVLHESKCKASMFRWKYSNKQIVIRDTW